MAIDFFPLQPESQPMIYAKVYHFVPIQDFSEPWTDEKLYAKYGITEEEQAFIESMIHPMDLENSND